MYSTDLHMAHSLSPLLTLRPITEVDYLAVSNTKESPCTRKQVEAALPFFFPKISPNNIDPNRICHNYFLGEKQLAYISLYSFGAGQYLYIDEAAPPYHILIHNTMEIDIKKSYRLSPVIYEYELKSSGERMVLKYTGYEWGPEYYELILR